MIGYPNQKKSYDKKTQGASNRGMNFERLIDESNQYYRSENKAVIHKKPTPVQIVNVSYPTRSQAKITEAYYKTPSTTDYNGIYKGHYIDFDVKETRSKTSFPLKNIHQHQMEHLKKIHAHQGIAFILIYFRYHDIVFLLPQSTLDKYVQRAQNGRKSIAYEELMLDAIPIEIKYRPAVDYLKAVDQLLQS